MGLSIRRLAALALATLVVSATRAPAQQPPVIPIGLDAYRQWERWPWLRIGQLTSMRSTYDRSGGNESADASHFLYQIADDRNVALDIEGPGVLNFVRYNHWHGSPWHYLVDGADFVLRETSTANPDQPRPDATFVPANLFPEPLAWTWATTRGADLIGVPIPFARSFRMDYERTHYGTGYYIFSRYLPGALLSRPIRAWDGRTPPPADVHALVARSGTDIAPQIGTEQGRRIGLRERHGTVALTSAAPITLTRIDFGPSMVRALELSAPREQSVLLGRARLRITWDDRKTASVDSPLALFFGAGTLYNRDGREYLVKAFPVNIRFSASRVHLACYFPMPFFKSARIELVGPGGGAISDVEWRLRYAPLCDHAEAMGYFHATYADHPHPEPGRDLVLLDTREAENGGDWSGHLVGTSFIFSHNADLGTLEGDPRFFFDDSRTPQVQGTGTEEWAGGGDYWGGQNMTLPFVGHPVGAPGPGAARSAEDRIESAYRYLLADLMPFGRNARIGLEHGGTNQSVEHYETVAYWYGAPGATLIRTDELLVGDLSSERAHGYVSPQASEPATTISRYEWGVDHVDGRQIYPEDTDRGRVMSGTSEFTMALDPRNVGILLRRKLDYSYPNQRAEVFVADVARHGQHGHADHWRPAGIWYLAGSNTCVYSDPKSETGAAQHIVQTSNRRSRDDDFLIGRALTRGRSSIRVRIRFTPVSRPLFPGYPVPTLGWSEMRYTAYCYVYPARR